MFIVATAPFLEKVNVWVVQKKAVKLRLRIKCSATYFLVPKAKTWLHAPTVQFIRAKNMTEEFLLKVSLNG